MRNCTYCLLTATIAALAFPLIVVADEEFSVVINPQTGAATLRNDTDTAVDLDGYLFVADPDLAVDVFDTGAAWERISDSTPGWFAGQATTKILSEVNLTSALSVPGRGTVSLGTPYEVFSPTAIGDAEPEFGFTYSVDGVGVFTGDVEFEVDNNVVLVVDPATGGAILQNQSIFDVSLDSYLIQSGRGVLDASDGAWEPLEDSIGGWTAPSDSSATRIREINVLGSTLLSANGGSLPIGAPVNPGLLEDESDLAFQFSFSSGGGLPGAAGVVGGVLFRSLVEEVAGDYNRDGIVDAADYIVWRKRLGQDIELPNTDPNDTDGMVTEAEYDFWKSRFGATSGSGSGGVASISTASTAVPEPSAGLIACACGLWVVGGNFVRGGRHRSRV